MLPLKRTCGTCRYFQPNGDRSNADTKGQCQLSPFYTSAKEGKFPDSWPKTRAGETCWHFSRWRDD